MLGTKRRLFVKIFKAHLCRLIRIFALLYLSLLLKEYKDRWEDFGQLRKRAQFINSAVFFSKFGFFGILFSEEENLGAFCKYFSLEIYLSEFFLIFLLEIFRLFYNSRSMIPNLVPEIWPCDGFCDAREQRRNWVLRNSASSPLAE